MSILKEKSRSISVKADASNEEFTYDFTYELVGKEIKEVYCRIKKIETDDSSGYMSFDGVNYNINFTDFNGADKHLKLFNDAVTEIRAALPK